jgi:hypothetical protein
MLFCLKFLETEKNRNGLLGELTEVQNCAKKVLTIKNILTGLDAPV